MPYYCFASKVIDALVRKISATDLFKNRIPYGNQIYFCSSASMPLARLKLKQISVLLGDISFRSWSCYSNHRERSGQCLLLFQSYCFCSLPLQARTCSSRISIRMSWAIWVLRRNYERRLPYPLARYWIMQRRAFLLNGIKRIEGTPQNRDKDRLGVRRCVSSREYN